MHMKKFTNMEIIDSYKRYNIFKRFKYRKIKNNFYYPEEITVEDSKFIFPVKNNKELKKNDLIMTYCAGCKKYEIIKLS